MRGWIILVGLVVTGCQRHIAKDRGAFERVNENPAEHGERLAKVLGCVGCHGKDLAGENWSQGQDRLWSANLTRAAQRYSDAEFHKVMTTARRPDGSELWEMPAHLFTKLSASEIAALIAYIRSRPVTGDIHPRAELGPELRAEVAAGTYRSSAAQARAEGKIDTPDAGPDHNLARRMVRATCAECHQLDLQGGQPFPGAAMRPDIRMMAASYSAKDFDRLLTTGIAAGGRELTLMTEVARGRYVYLTPRERRAIYEYLRALGDRAAR